MSGLPNRRPTPALRGRQPRNNAPPKASVPLYKPAPPESSLVLRAEQLRLSQLDTPVSIKSSADTTLPEYVPSVSRAQFLRNQVGHELNGHAYELPQEWANLQYRDPALFPTSRKIADFLRDEDLYHSDTSTWTELVADSVKLEKNVYPIILSIISSILSKLGNAAADQPDNEGTETTKSLDVALNKTGADGSADQGPLGRSDNTGSDGNTRSPDASISPPQATREAMNAENMCFRHVEIVENNQITYPDFVIRATGPSFEVPEGCPESDILTAVGYSNIATFIEMKILAGLKIEKLIEQVGVYVRQMFIQQPNRMFVRCMTLNQNIFRIFHFDRDGVKYTPPIDIHNSPEIFVRMILGLSSRDEKVLGLNTAIKWAIDPASGRKSGGTVTITGEDGKERKYSLINPQPSARCFTILGRGMIWWRAKTIPLIPGGAQTEVIVKFSWRAEDRQPEHEIMDLLVGIRGIAQMITWHAKEECTRTLANYQGDEPIYGPDGKKVRTRLGTCIILEAHGEVLGWYTSQRQLFGAIRDVVATLREVSSKTKLVHREINPANILLGLDGKSGVLMDFDSAIKYDRTSKEVSKAPRVGQFLYMSVASLDRCIPSENFKIRYDRLDDLEAVYYVLFVLMCTQMATGLDIVPQTNIYEEWYDRRVKVAQVAKGFYFSKKKLKAKEREHVSLWWSPAAVTALEEFFKIVKEIVEAKGAADGLDSDEKINKWLDFLQTTDSAYTRVLEVLDAALRDDNLGVLDESEPPNNQDGQDRAINQLESLSSPAAMRYLTRISSLTSGTPSSTEAIGEPDDFKGFRTSAPKRQALNMDRGAEPESPTPGARGKRARTLASSSGRSSRAQSKSAFIEGSSKSPL